MNEPLCFPHAHVTQEILTIDYNGVNMKYIAQYFIYPYSETVMINGVAMLKDEDYIIINNIVVCFIYPLTVGDRVTISYITIPINLIKISEQLDEKGRIV